MKVIRDDESTTISAELFEKYVSDAAYFFWLQAEPWRSKVHWVLAERSMQMNTTATPTHEEIAVEAESIYNVRKDDYAYFDWVRAVKDVSKKYEKEGA